MIAKTEIGQYIENLGAKTSSPGGGAVAAITGAQSIGLIEMVCQFTPENENETAIANIVQRTQTLAPKMLAHGDDDVVCFEALMASYKLPKSTTSEKSKRTQSIQVCLAAAATVPLNIIKIIHGVMRLLALSATTLSLLTPSTPFLSPLPASRLSSPSSAFRALPARASTRLPSSTLTPPPVAPDTTTDSIAYECDENAECVAVDKCDDVQCRTSLDGEASEGRGAREASVFQRPIYMNAPFSNSSRARFLLPASPLQSASIAFGTTSPAGGRLTLPAPIG